jgi:formate/nitrite transporter FocA (FNT family)
MLFVLCGMEHCVANTFLINFNNAPGFLVPYLINIAGNIAGAKIINWLMS